MKKLLFAAHSLGLGGIETALITLLEELVKKELGKVVDWSQVDKNDYLLAMERSPIKDIEIKYILKQALTDEINDREIYMKGIDTSYYYEGYTVYKAEDL